MSTFVASASSEVFIEDLKLRSFRGKLSPELSAANISDLQCMRFINARASAGIPAAVDMAEKWFLWRQTPLHDGSPITPINILEKTNADNICVGTGMHVHKDLIPHSLQGEDKDGRPLYWEKNGQISAQFDRVKAIFTVDDLIAMHIRTQELTSLRMRNLTEKHGKTIDKCVVIFDLANIPFMPDWQALEYIKRMLDIDQNFYPETLHSMIILNNPWYFATIFAIIKPWIDPNTAGKIFMLGWDYHAELKRIIADDQLPLEYGGTNANYVWTNSWAPESLCSQENIDIFLLADQQALPSSTSSTKTTTPP